MDNDWKNKLRERFSDYSVPEPDGLWEGIEQGLSGKTRRGRLPVWLGSALAAAASVALLLLLRPEGTSVQPVPEVSVPLAESVSDEPPSVEADVPENIVSVVPVASGSRRPLVAMVVEDEKDPKEKAAAEDKRIEEEVVLEDVPEIDSDEPVSAEETVVTIPEERESAVSGVEKEPRRVYVGMYREGGQALTDASEGFGLSNTGLMTRSTSAPSGEPTGLVQMLSANQASRYEARHKAPVRMGMTVSWEFARHLSLSSGLNWTTLSSEFEEFTVGTRALTEQRLGYLGIPLRLEAHVQPWKGLRLYAGAGGMAETCLSSQAETRSFIGDHLEETYPSRPDAGGLLWSVGALAGAEYRFTPHFGVYFAPGIEYHFDNGAAARSAYTEKPLHYNLSLGLRFQFGK